MLNINEFKELLNDGEFNFFSERGNFVNLDEYTTIYNWNRSVDIEYFNLNKSIDNTREITYTELIRKMTKENKDIYSALYELVKEVIDEVNK